MGPAGYSDHPLGWTPVPPGQCARSLKDDGSPYALKDAPTNRWAGLPAPPPHAGAPGFWKMMPPRRPPRCPNHPLGRPPVPPRPVYPVLERNCLPAGPVRYFDRPRG